MTFHGYVEEADIPGTYRHFDVLAVPSVPMPGWLEQFGRVVVESQASGIPVVASASGALPDVVGEEGLLVPPGDPRPSTRPWLDCWTSQDCGSRCGPPASPVPTASRGRAVARDQLALYRAGRRIAPA